MREFIEKKDRKRFRQTFKGDESSVNSTTEMCRQSFDAHQHATLKAFQKHFSGNNFIFLLEIFLPKNMKLNFHHTFFRGLRKWCGLCFGLLLSGFAYFFMAEYQFLALTSKPLCRQSWFPGEFATPIKSSKPTNSHAKSVTCFFHYSNPRLLF